MDDLEYNIPLNTEIPTEKLPFSLWKPTVDFFLYFPRRGHCPYLTLFKMLIMLNPLPKIFI